MTTRFDIITRRFADADPGASPGEGRIRETCGRVVATVRVVS